MNTKKHLLALAASLLALPFMAHAETLESALQSALQLNPKIAHAQVGVEISQSQLKQATAQTHGRLDVTAGVGLNEYNGYSAVAPKALMRPRSAGLTYTLPLYTGGRLERAIDAAKHGELASRGVQENARQQVLLSAGGAFLTVAHAQDLLALAKGQHALLVQELAQAKAELKAGIRTKTDVAQAQARLSGAQATVDQANASVQEALANFEAVAGRPFEGMPLKPDLTFSDQPHDYVQHVLAANPLVRANQARVAQAKDLYSAARVESRPSVSFTAGASTDRQMNPVLARQASQSVGLQISMPLFDGGLIASRTSEASLNAKAAQLELDDIAVELRAQAVGAWESYQGAQARDASLKDQVAAASIAVEGARQEAKVGTRTLLDVLNAEQELLDARVAKMGAEYEMAATTLRLRALAGELQVN
jgi:outer membrane protein